MLKNIVLGVAFLMMGGQTAAKMSDASFQCTSHESNATAVLRITSQPHMMYLEGDSVAAVLADDPIFKMSQLNEGLASVTYLFNQVTGELVVSGLAPFCFLPSDAKSCAINTIGSRWNCSHNLLR